MRSLGLILLFQTFLSLTLSYASPWGLPIKPNDQNMKIDFEVMAPWNILDGEAKEISGVLSLHNENDPGSLRADIAVQKLNYSAGLRAAGQIVAAWLEANPPTPARFVIKNTASSCTLENIAAYTPCKGTVDGQLTIWGKEYFIDIPVEIKNEKSGSRLEGFKKINFGEYGFGDPNSTIAKLKPNIELKFSVALAGN